jgi:hypothetical protein
MAGVTRALPQAIRPSAGLNRLRPHRAAPRRLASARDPAHSESRSYGAPEATPEQKREDEVRRVAETAERQANFDATSNVLCSVWVMERALNFNGGFRTLQCGIQNNGAKQRKREGADGTQHAQKRKEKVKKEKKKRVRKFETAIELRSKGHLC